LFSRGEDKCTHVTTLIAPQSDAAQSTVQQRQFSVTGETRCCLIGKAVQPQSSGVMGENAAQTACSHHTQALWKLFRRSVPVSAFV